MGTRTATNALVKRTTFSSAINIFPNEVTNGKAATTSENIIESDNAAKHSAQIRPYSEVPGPKGLPLIGNSWRFAPLIGELSSHVTDSFYRFKRIVFIFGYGCLFVHQPTVLNGMYHKRYL